MTVEMKVAAKETRNATAPATVDFDAIKRRQQITWTSGDYSNIGVRLQVVGELLAETVDVRAGERVLDVAAGNGNATLAAARRFANVTSTDYVPELLEKGARRALADGLPVELRVADAESLPFDDGSFDVALSSFGVMFAPNQARAASELQRVVRSGGRIGMANWTPEGFIGELFRAMAGHVPPPAGIQSPTLWGSEPRIVELFGPQAADIRCNRTYYNFRFRSAAHWIEVFRACYGPMHKAYESLDAEHQEFLTCALTELLERRNVGGPDSLIIPSEYLEVVVIKK